MSISFVTPWTVALPGSCIHEIFQERTLEWVVISFFRGSPQPSTDPQLDRSGFNRGGVGKYDSKIPLNIESIAY